MTLSGQRTKLSYSMNVTVHLGDEPRILGKIRKALELPGVQARAITLRTGEPGSKEVSLELLLEDSKVSGALLRKIEGIRGAAITAASEPKEIPLPN